jgi:hypothetical protein
MPNERSGGGSNGGTATTYWPGAVAADAGRTVEQGGRDQVEIGACIVGLADGLVGLPPIYRRRALRHLDFEIAKVESAIRRNLDALEAVRDILSEYAQQLAVEMGRKDAADE